MIKPKLALIPSAYKQSTVYSVLPSDGVGDFDFTRSGEATRINKDGLIETVDSNVPRLNYPLINGVVSGCPSLLLEPTRTNLLTYSEDFSDASWDNNGTIVSNASISPDGTQTAELFYASTDTGRRVFQNKTIVSGSSYTVSVYAKANNKNFLYLSDIDNQLSVVWFDLLNGTYSTPSEGTANIESIGNDWYRCSLTTTSSTTTGWAYFGISDTSNSVSFTANGTDGIYLWGAQIEQSSFPTSYIPSLTGSQTTRSAETCNNSGDVNTFNDSEGVLMAEISALANGGLSKRISLTDESGTVNNRVSLEIDEIANTIKVFMVSNSVLVGQITITNINQTQNNKIAIKYNISTLDLYVNGFLQETDNTISSMPIGLSSLFFSEAEGSFPFYGNTKQMQYFDTALTDTDLEELTSWRSFNEMAQDLLYTIL